jgi:antitoxin ParD1/3/4
LGPDPAEHGLGRPKSGARITITLTPEMAQAVRGAVEEGEYASSSEIIREALSDWRNKRALQQQALAEMRAQIQEGLADIEAGRVSDFDAERIIRRGEERSDEG